MLLQQFSAFLLSLELSSSPNGFTSMNIELTNQFQNEMLVLFNPATVEGFHMVLQRISSELARGFLIRSLPFL